MAAFIEPGLPWQIGYDESGSSRPPDERLNGEISYGLTKARIVIEGRRGPDSTKRPHANLGYRPPAPAVVPRVAGPPPLRRLPRPSRTSPPSIGSEPGHLVRAGDVSFCPVRTWG
ncbi:integrase core domain-containing protein [Aureimonas sp. AU12]|uniref:integrase core domain-containing protein n=1 Tax=Aureimonas sp. AU12 TaxID=1638161 RepID=UPI0009E905EB